MANPETQASLGTRHRNNIIKTKNAAQRKIRHQREQMGHQRKQMRHQREKNEKPERNK